jgi:hypothetical protein
MTVVVDGTSGITTNSGTLISATTIGVGGATPSTSGAGITFPVTQSASSNAKTLDDYEEGTFTPTLTFGGNNVGMTYNYQKGYYAKIGKNVYFNIYISVSSIGSSTGVAAITNLPFITALSATSGDIYIPFSQRNAITTSAPVFGYSSNATVLSLYSTNLLGGGASNLTNSNFANASEFNIQGWYQTTN